MAFVGLGTIGLPIAANLISAGFKMKVHTRSRKAEKDKRLKGAISCSSPKEVVKGCEVLLICVSDDEAIEEVLFSSQGAYKNLKKKSLVIDFSTISPAKSRSIAKRLAKQNVDYIDAPVTGGTEGANKGSLTIFLGCKDIFLKEIIPFLKPIATNIYCFGEVGKGQEVKAINQILVAGSYAAVAEAIALGEQLDLPMDAVIKALQTGAASSWALSNRSNAMLKDEYPLGFKLGLHYKDLSIALNTAESIGLELPITKKVREIEKELISEGFENEDVSVLKRSIRKSSVIFPKKN
ncbi:2-hydroxy-3-oxopropionate reductase [Prochlorococcus sp. SS52]|nr:2-hydroxy-3-oxopropionate reductase [Prochlorococcus sp. SS52]